MTQPVETNPTQTKPEERKGSRWRMVLAGAALGMALGVLAAFLGEIRAPVGLLLALVLVGALAGAFRKTLLALALGSGVVVAAVGLCLLTPILRTPLQTLTLSQPPRAADAIVVLGGGVNCGNATLRSESLSRLVRGLELWRAGYAPVITVSEQSNLLGSPDCPRMSVLERDLIRTLYPDSGPRVLTLPNVTTTRDEAARVRDLARAHVWQRILLVTSPSHSRRAARLFQSYGLNVTSVPSPELQFDQTLPLPSDRLYALRVLLYEGLSRLKASLGGTPER